MKNNTFEIKKNLVSTSGSTLLLKDVKHALDICLNLISIGNLMMMVLVITLMMVNGSSVKDP